MSTPWTNSVSVSYIGTSGDYRIDGLLKGTKWGSEVGSDVTLTYSFPTYPADPNSWYWSTSAYGSYYGDGEPWDYRATGLSSSEQSAVINALSKWSAVADIRFVKVADNASTVGDIRFAWTYDNASDSGQAWAYLPHSSPAGGDVWLNSDATWRGGFAQGTYGYLTLIHELGHTLGLSHTFVGSGSLGGALPVNEDGYHNSIMSYTALAGSPGTWADFNPTTPMLYDIAAIQYLYGANTSYHAGNDTYYFYSGKDYFQTIWDAGGTDTIVWVSTTESATIDLRPGEWSDLGNTLKFRDGYSVDTSVDTVAIYYTVTIENATGGSRNDVIIGNDAANILNGGGGADRIQGGLGNDVLDGGLGADSLIGGLGNDTYVVDNVGDVVTEGLNAGIDRVRSGISYVLGANLENLTLLGTTDLAGTGNGLANILAGNSGANTLNGGGGNDVLDGGLGADTLIGGLGNDTYVVGNVGDVVTEGGNGGIDLVRSGISYVLGANLENLTLLGTTDLAGTGNSLANILAGNSGANTLDGALGADILVGGLGNDTYHVDLKTVGAGATATAALEDTITEVATGGIDTLVLRGSASNTVTTTLTLASTLENLDASATGTTRLNLTGNGTANTLTGNAAANILDGGLGADTLVGGLGNDNYVVDNALDVVTEAADGGIDRVSIKTGVAGGSYTLTENVENGTLLNTVTFNLSGNGLDNVLTGNAAANVLDGGVGADALIGGLGNDTYEVDNAGDVVTEGLNAGIDRVRSGISYVLGANLENLTLLGTTDLAGTGNGLANILAGNSGANTLDGGGGNDRLRGGDGSDWLIGGAGTDHFVFDTTDALVHADTIFDFVTGIDTIDLSASVFDGLGTIGQRIGLGDHLTYDADTGSLIYDADGVGTGGNGICFATLGDSLHPGSIGSDFMIIA